MKRKLFHSRIASALRDSRISAGKTQSELARCLKLTSAQFVSNIERGLVGLPPKDFKKTAKFLGVSPSIFLRAHLYDQRDQTIRDARFSKAERLEFIS